LKIAEMRALLQRIDGLDKVEVVANVQNIPSRFLQHYR